MTRWCAFVLIACLAVPLAAQSSPTRGPDHGALVLKGGVGPNHAIDSAFVALAGGPNANIVVIPTASIPDPIPPALMESLTRRMKASLGVGGVTILHAVDRISADSDSFNEPLRHATGVWILGGFPERMVHSYLGTRTEQALRELVERGGVVGGESAGAMIQASWLDTTDAEDFTPEVRTLVRAHRTGGGFGLLSNAAIFPHFDSRGSAAAVAENTAHPDQLAIGIDNETALVVRGTIAEVVGLGTVTMYIGTAKSGVVLHNGERYDLAAHRKRE